MVLLIDNYDSFTYNLYQYIGSVQPDIKVVRNDEVTIEDIEKMAPSHIIISPGPGRPEDAGICVDVIKYFAGKIPMLGICLGHQAICQAFGARITYADRIMHGKQSVVRINREAAKYGKTSLFEGMGERIKAGRYHSLIAAADSIPQCLKITASTLEDEVMAVSHMTFPVFGLQFHPESILTEDGDKIIKNFLNMKLEETNIKKDRMYIREAITVLSRRENLSEDMMEAVMEEIMTGEAKDSQKGAFLTALSLKGETIEEVTAAARVMAKHCAPFNRKVDTLEIVGTGGDRSNTINISTMSAIITSAAGYAVSKHGNRAASSKCGTADCLEALGVKIDTDTVKSEKALENINLCFLFAQKYHPAMRFVGAVRRDIGIRTMFNVLGPISNPAKANRMLLGVYDKALVEPLARVLANLKVDRGMVVYGMDCMDEISLSDETYVCEFDNTEGEFSTYYIKPEDYGFERCVKDELVGGDPKENADITLKILGGKLKGPMLNAVLLNSGAAIHIADGRLTIEEGIEKARKMIESGEALRQLQRFVEATN